MCPVFLEIAPYLTIYPVIPHMLLGILVWLIYILISSWISNKRDLLLFKKAFNTKQQNKQNTAKSENKFKNQSSNLLIPNIGPKAGKNIETTSPIHWMIIL